jgi:hypothetical protein
MKSRMKEIDQLVKMANQIAANFSFHEDGVEQLTIHLRKFWAPVMIRQLGEHIAAGNSGVNEMVLQAMHDLQTDQAPARAE